MGRLMICLVLFGGVMPWAADGPPPVVEAKQQLAHVRRIYIAILTGGDSALEIRDLLMASLQNTKDFIITEDEDRADAVIRGAAKDQVFNETHESSDSINAHSQIGTGASSSSKASGLRYAGVTIGEHDNHRSQERKHEALLTVRMVNRDGDVIWSGTAESQGGKFLGASADVADRIAKDLAEDYRRAMKVADPHPVAEH
jgi:hypothetical protein